MPCFHLFQSREYKYTTVINLPAVAISTVNFHLLLIEAPNRIYLVPKNINCYPLSYVPFISKPLTLNHTSLPEIFALNPKT